MEWHEYFFKREREVKQDKIASSKSQCVALQFYCIICNIEGCYCLHRIGNSDALSSALLSTALPSQNVHVSDSWSKVAASPYCSLSQCHLEV